jgi:serine/threonine-protein kinase
MMIRARDSQPPAADTAGPAWVPGTRFSNYEIESLLATGGMAEVWRAKMKGVAGFEKRVVIKTMLTSLQHRRELVDMFVSEASLAARLSHPNIVDVFDFGQLEGRYFIAMSFVPGLTLRSVHRRMRVRHERLPVAAALHIARDLCEALQHVHELEDGSGPMGLIHRDLSPDNVIVSTSGTAKVIDFGAARATSRTPPSQLFVGRYRYAAPERVRHEGEDGRSDVYSAGIVLYECLTGMRPFNGSDAEVVKAVVASRGCDPRGRVPSLPGNVAELVKKATAYDPRDRFGSAREMGAAIARALLQIGASSKERDVTAALSALLDAEGKSRESEAVPQPVESTNPSDSDAVLALSEVEMLEASGPIRAPEAPTLVPEGDTERISLPLPPEAFPPPRHPTAANLIDAVRSAAALEPGRNPLERAVELFDLGLGLRAQQRYDEALEAWREALALAPENLVYQASVQRLSAQLANRRD